MSPPHNCTGDGDGLVCDVQDLQQTQALLQQQSAVHATTNELSLILWASSLVFLMQCGFAMLTAGAVRSKNTTNILMSIVCIVCNSCLSWFLFGYAFAFGGTGPFIGTKYFAGTNMVETVEEILRAGSIEGTWAQWLFQYTFAAVATTIVSGAVAERATMETYLTFSCWIPGFVYPVVAHWLWGGGFLHLGLESSWLETGALDVSGCGPVHLLGGLCGAVGSYMIGPRYGRFDPETGAPVPIYGHSTTLVALGTFLLWVGWFGFNAGSTAGVEATVASRTVVCTLLGSVGGVISSVAVSSLENPDGKWDATFAMNGALAGLVSVTAGCAVMEPWAGLVVGLVAGVIYLYSSFVVIVNFGVDDPLDAIPVHLFCGMWGIVAVGFFAKTEFVEQVYELQVPVRNVSGVFYAGNGLLLACQIIEVVLITVWVVVWITPYFWILQYVDRLRVPSDKEIEGGDTTYHGAPAYPESVNTSTHGTDEQWNKYLQSTIVERTPTGKIIVNARGPSASTEVDDFNAVIEQDSPDINSALHQT